MENKTLAQGAEAIISLTKENTVSKHRIKKSYRLPFLDNKIRKQRTKSEAKILVKASKLIPVPNLIKTDDKENLEIEFIQGKKLSENLDDLKDNLEICTTIGKQIAILHDNDIIHGDLTTSNMIYVPINKLNDKKDVNVKSSHQGSSANNNNNLKHPIPDLQDNNLSFKVYFIDFGLSYISKRAEDKAVDRHLIKQALEAKHFKHFESFFSHVLKGYEKTSKDSNPILERFKKVELRGRYKQQF